MWRGGNANRMDQQQQGPPQLPSFVAQESPSLVSANYVAEGNANRMGQQQHQSDANLLRKFQTEPITIIAIPSATSIIVCFYSRLSN